MKLRPVLTTGAVGALILASGVAPAYADTQNVENVDVVGAEKLAKSLVGENIDVQSYTYTGSNESAGMFSGFADAIGIGSGVVLSTGLADHRVDDAGEIVRKAVLPGPNDEISTGTSMSEPGDDDLSALVGTNTNDASVLEIEFIPEGDTVSFNYVFGSEEYPNFVGSGFNDVFAFFVNGENQATLADNETFVSINNINEDSNSEFFRVNYLGEDGAPINTGLNGLTTVLGFEADVKPGEVNTLKLAIADTSDSIYDSAVMIQAGSFTSPVNTQPVGEDQTIEVEIDTAQDFVLAGSDADEDELTFEVANAEGLEGEIVLDGPNATFTPAEGFVGTTSFTYVVNDGTVNSEPATVTLNVVDPAAEPSPTPTEEPSEEPTDEPTATDEPSETPSDTPSPSPTATPSETATPTPSESATTTAPVVDPTTPSVEKQQPVDDSKKLSETGAWSLPLALAGGFLVLSGVVLMYLRKRNSQA